MKKNLGSTVDQKDYTGTVTFAEIKVFLQKKSAKNVAYQLAGQLASTELAMETGYIREDTVVFAPSLIRFAEDDDDPLKGYISPLGLISLGVVVGACVTELREHPFTHEADAWWPYQRALLTVLERVNSEAITHMAWY